MTSSIAVIVPTRGRPQRFNQFLDAWLYTQPEADLIVAIDKDDPTIGDYRIPGWAIHHVGPRMGLMPTLDSLATMYAYRYDIVGHLGDDHYPRTQRWDTHVREALSTPGIAFGDDKFQSGPNQMPTHVFISSEIIRELGRMCCPGVRHFGDTYWKDLGEQAGVNRYMPDVVFEHVHFGNNKAPNDVTYTHGGGNWDVHARDKAAWLAYYDAGHLAEDVAKIKQLAV